MITTHQASINETLYAHHGLNETQRVRQLLDGFDGEVGLEQAREQIASSENVHWFRRFNRSLKVIGSNMSWLVHGKDSERPCPGSPCQGA